MRVDPRDRRRNRQRVRLAGNDIFVVLRLVCLLSLVGETKEMFDPFFCCILSEVGLTWDFRSCFRGNVCTLPFM